MEKFWEKALTATGSVAVVGFILTILINNLFEEEIINLFGSEKLFYLIMVILCILGCALLIAILKNNIQSPKQDVVDEKNGGTKTATITKSKIKGDIVFGDKTVNQDGKRE